MYNIFKGKLEKISDYLKVIQIYNAEMKIARRMKMKKTIKFLMTTVAITAGVLAFSKADSSAAVTGIMQTEGKTTSVSLQWNTDLGAKSYAIQFSQDGTAWYTMETTSSTSDTVYNLTAGSTYYARVGSFSVASWKIDKTNTQTPVSGWSNPVEVVTAPSTDGMTLIQSGATTKSITMKSSDVIGANMYQIYTGDFQIGESTTSTIKTSASLNAGTSYDVKCYPCRKAETTGFVAKSSSVYVSGWSAKTLTNKVEKDNFGFTNIWYNLNDYKIGIFADSAVGSYDGVQVQLQTPSGKNKRTCTGSGDTVELKNLNGTFYRYRIRTYVECDNNKKAYSAWSTYRYFGLSSKISAQVNKKSVKLSWSSVKNASGYTVMISTNQEAGFKKIKSTKSTSVTIKKCGKSKLKKHKTYYIRILTNAKSGKNTNKSDLVNTYSFYMY